MSDLLAILPPLRDDLRLYEAPPDVNGWPTWTLYDPVRGRYFRLGQAAFRLLAQWRLGEAARVLERANADCTIATSARDLVQLLRFLRANSLLAEEGEDARASLESQKAAMREGPVTWLLHNYLFLRIPLIRPDRLLALTLPLIRPLMTAWFIRLTLVVGALGLLLVLRQWDAFRATAIDHFTWDGITGFAATLVAVKVLHEFGHGWQARRFGVPVRSQGVAFIVLWPVLYSDTTDAWRLVSRRQRLLIGAGGMLVELTLACWATLAWSFLPEGYLRSAAFMVATVTWISSLAINLNPLMRFDGYYLTSDLLGIENLQARSFALARWRLRELLFGHGAPPPEHFRPLVRERVLLFGYATWVYRFFLFTGIAAVVFHLFFKPLGPMLAFVEIWWFVWRPVQRELAAWWQLRERIRLRPGLALGLLALGGGLWLLATPWQSYLHLPAVLQAERYTALYPPHPARIARILHRDGDRVEAGALLFQLESPDLDFQLEQTRQELSLTQALLQRTAADPETLARAGVLESQLASQLTEARGLSETRERLAIRAPFAGRLVDLPPGLREGLWVAPNQPIGRLVDPSIGRVRAYATGPDLPRLQVGATGRFLPEDPGEAAIPVVVESVETVGVRSLEGGYLSQQQGGPIETETDARGRVVPSHTLYRVLLRPLADGQGRGAGAPDRVLRGSVSLQAEATSPLARLWRNAVAVVIRESGF
ncbi:putative peptide zinc metalloprotease protein [Tistlia consotensis]|uniref:Putative peptide zinc metalloprotease protein n=1 Tax=Tistlia consotensis USBA 355 TaxID=560819 RepID=A0A1Y6CLW3_9PROT|nr:site-2 protease family protein [Tistlia consotensis]SMF72548.1 putative peptide zinc metalloprotease protein [Tistlia consotensis USBA 355]SNS09348.1 putative peptide zinc metalloprotease protein [Tistlia consotensis]